jgi:hypothetical protein
VAAGGNVSGFFDGNLANRVAKALVHAVELCGSSSQPERFLEVAPVMIRCLMMICFAALAVGAALAQQRKTMPQDA